MSKPISLGGLGIGNLNLRKKALLFKWHWRFALEVHALWDRNVVTMHWFLPSNWVSNPMIKGTFRNTRSYGIHKILKLS